MQKYQSFIWFRTKHWILYYYDQCKTSSFDNSISYGEQEIDFQLGSILPVKSCKNVSLSYASTGKHCTFYYHLNSIFLLSMQTQFFHFQISNRKWNFKLFLLYFSFSNVKQEIEFQFGSAIPLKSCKIASNSYTFKA